MIITALQGGLGNQMFQYGAGLALATKLKTELKLDIQYYNKDKKRNFELDNFNISAREADLEEIQEITRKSFFSGLLDTFSKRKKEVKMFADPYYFDTNFFNQKDNSYLKGFWQNEKYFQDINNILLKEFSLKNPLPESANPLLTLIKDGNSVSVHVRRGDYVQPKYQKIFHQCTAEYYSTAMNFVCQKTKNPQFFIFSDDIEWVKNMQWPEGAVFAGPEYRLKSFEEMALMSMCKHNIISNSTFSWWSAWLNRHPGKMVIAPKKWLVNQKEENCQINLPSWITI